MLERRISPLLLGAAIAILFGQSRGAAATLAVGPGQTYGRIEQAYDQAQPGDTIVVHPQNGNEPYRGVALSVHKPRIRFSAAPSEPGQRVRISGEGFTYSGVGRVPRAIFQFNADADGGLVEGFDLSEAHNNTHNGAAVRINQANHITVRDCEIRDNDMGIMSNGDGTQKAAVNQLIERCHIHHNGAPADPGYNHNLYLGGTSVTLRFCHIHSSLTGHNFKSRAHHNRIEYCYLHSSANREFDLVDGADTTAPNSDSVLIGNVIVKAEDSTGNRTVIHYGQDGGGEHDGTLHLVHNTIVTPFIAPVVDLSAPNARASLVGNLITDGGAIQRNQVLVHVRNRADLRHITGTHNWFSHDLAPPEGTGIDRDANHIAPRGETPPLAAPQQHDYRLQEPAPHITDAGPPRERLSVPPVPGATDATESSVLEWQYRHLTAGEPRPHDGKPDLGAYEYQPHTSQAQPQ